MEMALYSVVIRYKLHGYILSCTVIGRHENRIHLNLVENFIHIFSGAREEEHSTSGK